jgi:hypothetical protein
MCEKDSQFMLSGFSGDQKGKFKFIIFFHLFLLAQQNQIKIF